MATGIKFKFEFGLKIDLTISLVTRKYNCVLSE